MSNTTHRRRFIAGAVCPRCGAMDKIVVDMDTECRECVACGFSEQRPTDSGGPGELPTRVSRAAARRVETPAEAVTLVDPRAADKPDGE
ncbi:YheV family putative metal-binding protein [Seongchinamella sediminis]|uniref:YheV family putative metal-binding protein n=1 Tax=Seongchinamella sediminis TaxID=2283635 RepID=A0A3L7DZK4_9GAMM|nr:YheV family putative zinc ribbon protein [Seongchinamella sediminis]RLQ22095.1 YheV family putative metal-binding protein [Seongchinamella sediminis]